MTTSKEGLLKDKVVSLVNGATVFQDEKSAYINAILRLITTYGIEEREDEMVRLKNAGGAKGYGSHLIIDYADGRIAELTKLKGEK